MRILGDKIADQRFLRLIRKALKAGYFEFRTFKHSIVGTPQGSIISPILANIYMEKLDGFVAKLKSEFDKGIKKVNPIWSRLQNRKMRAKSESKLEYHRQLLQTLRRDPLDQTFNKLVYVRYADD